jgi:acyl dehydratase
MSKPSTATEITFDELCAPHLNQWSPYQITVEPVTATAIRRFCEVAEDGNPVYWDEEFAKSTRFGRLVAPPQFLWAMTFEPWWTPQFVKDQHAADLAELNAASDDLVGHPIFELLEEHGYVVSTVAGQEMEYLDPFGPGDGRIKTRSKTTAVTPEKVVRVGRGVFLTTVSEYRTEVDDRLIAQSTNSLLRYRPDEDRAQ